MSVTRHRVEREEGSAQRLSENSVMIKFVPKDHMAEELGINENLFYFPPYLKGLIEMRRMRWTKHVAHT
jgi:hypothetical protein